MKSIGIDIGSSSIKIAVVENVGKRLVVTDYKIHSLNLNPGQDHEIETIDYLRQVFRSYENQEVEYSLAIDPRVVTTRIKAFAFRERAKIAKTIGFELEEDLPMEIDDLIIETKILRTFTNGASVLALAVAKEQIEKKMDQAKDLGISLHRLDIETTAIGTLFEEWWNPPVALNRSQYLFDEEDLDGPVEAKKETRKTRVNNDENTVIATQIAVVDDGTEKATALFHFGHSKTHLIIYSQNGLIDTLTIDAGMKRLIERVSKKYEIPFTEAKNEVDRKSFVVIEGVNTTPDQRTFSDLVVDSLEPIVTRARLFLADAEHQHKIRIEMVLLSGGGSGIKQLGNYFSKELGRKSKVLDSYPSLSTGMPDLSLAQINTLIVAVGLAVGQFRKPRNPACNLLKGEFSPGNNLMAQIWQDWRKPLQYFAASFVVLLVYTQMRSCIAQDLDAQSYDNMLAVLKTEPQLANRNTTPEKVLNFVDKKERSLRNQQKIASIVSMTSALDILKSLSDAMPSRRDVSLSVQTLSIVENKVEIKGRLKDPGSRTRLVKALAKVAKDGKVTDQSRALGPNGLHVNLKVERIGSATE